MEPTLNELEIRENRLRDSVPVSGKMSLVRARKIVRAINAQAFAAAGMTPDVAPGWLANVSLVEMLEAKTIVRSNNCRIRSNQSGIKLLDFEPDDKLIAAVYTILHYSASGGIVVSGDGERCLAVISTCQPRKDDNSCPLSNTEDK